jgi:LysM repeat protein
MTLNDFFSKPTRIKEAYANNYPSYPAADAADASSDSDSEPTFNRLAKTGKEPELDFRTGLDVGDDEEEFFEPDVRIGKPVEPDAADTDAFMSAVDSYGEQNPYMQSWGGKYATGGSGEPQWRYVEKGEDPARYGSDTTVSGAGTPNWRSIAGGKLAADWGSIPPALDLAPKSKYRFDQTTQSQVPIAGSGANPNIDDATRARARAWAARKNALGGMRAQDAGPDNSAPAVVKPVVVKPVTVSPVAKPAEVPAAATLRDIPAEKPMSWKDIAQANNISNPNLIMPGQVLKIPGRADYTVKPGDTLADIASGKTKAPKYTPSATDTQPAAAAVLKKYPNIGTLAPIPRDVMKDLGMDAQTKKEIAKYGREELLTPAIIQQQKKADADIAAIDAKMRDRAAAASRKKVKEDDIDNQTQVSSIERDSTSDIDGKTNQSFSSTSFQQDPANPGNNSYMDRQDNNGVASTTYARNVTPKWMDNLKATAGLPGAKPSAQPPSQYPTQVGQGENNKPFAAYSTPPGQLEINRESLDRMQSLAGIRKK